MRGTERIAGTDYGPVAKLLHWLVVALLAGQFVIAWTMPGIHRDTPQEDLVNLHLWVGALILLVVLARALWRLTHPVPMVTDSTPEWQQRAAAATHVALYLLLVIVPVLGWANASSRGFTVTLFNLVTLPALLAKDSAFGHSLGDIHTVLSYVLLGVVGLHVLAALYHRVVLRDDVLSRMLPGRS
jgi:cytochrome b561